MKVLILGANGMLGPWVSKVLSHHEIIETDLEKIPSNINYHKIDISNTKDVLKVSEGVDAIINLSVLRTDRKLAFDVNTLGNYNMMLAAETHKIPRIITECMPNKPLNPSIKLDPLIINKKQRQRKNDANMSIFISLSKYSNEILSILNS